MARRLWARESQARLSWNSIEALRDTHKERERERDSERDEGPWRCGHSEDGRAGRPGSPVATTEAQPMMPIDGGRLTASTSTYNAQTSRGVWRIKRMVPFGMA